MQDSSVFEDRSRSLSAGENYAHEGGYVAKIHNKEGVLIIETKRSMFLRRKSSGGEW